jgi:hypothetical protein
MNDKELEELLKSARTPERSGSYWEEFPGRVTAKLHWQRTDSESRPSVRPGRGLALRWGFGLAAACLVFAFWLGFWRGKEAGLTAGQLADARKYYHEIEGLFPNQVKAIVFDQKGAHLVLAENSEIPSSPPLFIRICGPKGCEKYITFSGQKIHFGAEDYEVLATPRGEVMLIGANSAWTGAATANVPGSLRIEARPLEAVL